MILNNRAAEEMAHGNSFNTRIREEILKKGG